MIENGYTFQAEHLSVCLSEAIDNEYYESCKLWMSHFTQLTAQPVANHRFFYSIFSGVEKLFSKYPMNIGEIENKLKNEFSHSFDPKSINIKQIYLQKINQETQDNVSAMHLLLGAFYSKELQQFEQKSLVRVCFQILIYAMEKNNEIKTNHFFKKLKIK